jgi:hypothetical protein
MSGRLILASLMVVISGCVAPPPAVYVAAPPPAPTLVDRLAADEQRIRDGLRLGQFTGPEYNELQQRHDAIEGSRREQLALGGGRFGPGQYEQLVAR